MSKGLFAVPSEAEFAEACENIELDDFVAMLIGKKHDKRAAILRLATIAGTILVAEKATIEQFGAVVDKSMALQLQYIEDRLREPRVILEPLVQAEIDADPEKKAALAAASEKLLTALRLTKDGTYASFEDAMTALTGHRPVKLTPEEAEAILDNDPSHHTKQ